MNTKDGQRTNAFDDSARRNGRPRRVASLVNVTMAMLLFSCTISSRGVEPTTRAAAAPVTVEGTVSRFERLPPAEKQLQENAVITMSAEGKLIRVELAPGWFLDEQGLRFQREQAIIVTGMRHADEDVDIIVADEVMQDGRRIRLRDLNGKPLWSTDGEIEEPEQ